MRASCDRARRAASRRPDHMPPWKTPALSPGTRNMQGSHTNVQPLTRPSARPRSPLLPASSPLMLESAESPAKPRSANRADPRRAWSPSIMRALVFHDIPFFQPQLDEVLTWLPTNSPEQVVTSGQEYSVRLVV